MGRIMKMIRIKAEPESEGEEVLAAFDTGAERSYIKRSRLPEGVQCIRIPAFTTGLGGSSNEINESCTVIAELRGLPFDMTVHPVNKIGALERKEVDIIVGATTMEQWEMIPNPRTKELDISGWKNVSSRNFESGPINARVSNEESCQTGCTSTRRDR